LGVIEAKIGELEVRDDMVPTIELAGYRIIKDVLKDVKAGV